MELRTETQNLLDMLSSNKKQLDKIILDFLPKTGESAEIQLLYDMMKDYPSRGGKGLRGSLCLLWCELFSGKKLNAMVTASALELFQNWILIHDDIEDGSDLRRGLPALHKKHGVELSINAGDALHGKMWELLLTNKSIVGEGLTLDILSEFTAMLNETTEGQQIELSWTYLNNWDISEKDYLVMVTKKAAWYTCITPCRLGVLLSSLDRDAKGSLPARTSNIMERIVDFGTNLGIAFQIVDDVLNLTADESKYGKEILGDLFEGKRTIMLIHLLDYLDEKRKTNVLEILSKQRSEKSVDEIRQVFDLMKESGSIEYARRVASNHSRLAMESFDEITSEQSKKHPRIYKNTRSVLEYLSSRDY
jgi:geranylgeranyl diphosphate synthase, type II